MRSNTLEIKISPKQGESYPTELQFFLPNNRKEITGKARFDLSALNALELNPQGYGILLLESLLEDPELLKFFDLARAASANQELRIQLRIDTRATELHELKWERIRLPGTQAWLAADENLVFSRFLVGDDWSQVQLRSKETLRVLIAVANPLDLAESRYAVRGQTLHSIDVDGETARAVKALGDLESDVLVSDPEDPGVVTWTHLQEALGKGYDILYLVAHGALIKSEPVLLLEKEDSQVKLIPGSFLVNEIRGMKANDRPRLVVMASCQSAGELVGLGPELARAGVPAVLAMHGELSMETNKAFMPKFFTELLLDGQVDRAVAAARRRVSQRHDAWMPVLFTRLEDGRLWRTEQTERKIGYQPPHLPDPKVLPEPSRRDDLPPGSTLRQLRNDIFTGRETDLLELANDLLFDPQPVAVIAHGLPGTGKTQLALEFCYRYGQFFQGVHWIQVNPESHNPDNDIRQGIVSCGDNMKINPWPKNFDEKLKVTRLAWEEDSPRLLVLDNLEHPELLRMWLPDFRGCRVLVTARRGRWDGGEFKTYELTHLSHDDSLKLLFRLCPRMENESSNDLDELTERLGRLPLALVLVGYYLLDRIDLSLKEYVESLRSRNVLEDPAFKSWIEDGQIGHKTDLVATFLQSWSSLESDSLTDLLARSTFFAGGYMASNWPIPVEILIESVFAEKEDRVSFFKALRRLYELGLFSVNENRPTIHPLLAEFARFQAQSMGIDSLEQVSTALNHMTNRIRSHVLTGETDSLHPHLEACARFALDTKSLLTGATLLNNLGLLIFDVSRREEAWPYFKQALAIYLMLIGSDHPLTNFYERIQKVQIDSLNLPDDLPKIEYVIRTQRIPIWHDLHATFQKVGSSSQQLNIINELAPVRQYYEQAIEIYSNYLEKDSPETATSLDNLGFLMYALHDLEKAEFYFNQAYALRSTLFGDLHSLTARSFINLILIDSESGKSEEALNELATLLAAIQPFELPDTHPYQKFLGLIARQTYM